jgi:hypothetical protein
LLNCNFISMFCSPCIECTLLVPFNDFCWVLLA